MCKFLLVRVHIRTRVCECVCIYGVCASALSCMHVCVHICLGVHAFVGVSVGVFGRMFRANIVNTRSLSRNFNISRLAIFFCSPANPFDICSLFTGACI